MSKLAISTQSESSSTIPQKWQGPIHQFMFPVDSYLYNSEIWAAFVAEQLFHKSKYSPKTITKVTAQWKDFLPLMEYLYGLVNKNKLYGYGLRGMAEFTEYEQRLALGELAKIGERIKDINLRLEEEVSILKEEFPWASKEDFPMFLSWLNANYPNGYPPAFADALKYKWMNKDKLAQVCVFLLAMPYYPTPVVSRYYGWE